MLTACFHNNWLNKSKLPLLCGPFSFCHLYFCQWFFQGLWGGAYLPPKFYITSNCRPWSWKDLIFIAFDSIVTMGLGSHQMWSQTPTFQKIFWGSMPSDSPRLLVSKWPARCFSYFLSPQNYIERLEMRLFTVCIHDHDSDGTLIDFKVSRW